MVEIEREGNKVLVKTDTRIDTINASEFERAIFPILSEENVNVVFDCSQLDYISSSGLRVILKAQKMITGNNGEMTLKGVKPQIKKVFDMTGFTRFLKFV